MPRKRINVYEIQEKLNANNVSSNTIYIATKIHSNSKWYLKALQNPFQTYEEQRHIAYREVTAQEILRLLNPLYPKTRLLMDDDKQIYIASKAITDCQLVSDIDIKSFATNIINNQYTGLGFAMIGALFVNEDDFKLANLVISTTSEVIKIDGGACFTNCDLYKSKNAYNGREHYKITARDIASLPKVSDYKPSFWLQNNEIDLSQLINDTPQLRHEINETILKIISLPNELLTELVSVYVDDKQFSQLLSKEIIQRKCMLRQEALKVESFKTYALSQEAETSLMKFIKSLSGFTPSNQVKLKTERYKPLIQNEYNKIKKLICHENNSQHFLLFHTRNQRDLSNTCSKTLCNII